jgi:hypothetical protein
MMVAITGSNKPNLEISSAGKRHVGMWFDYALCYCCQSMVSWAQLYQVGAGQGHAQIAAG